MFVTILMGSWIKENLHGHNNKAVIGVIVNTNRKLNFVE